MEVCNKFSVKSIGLWVLGFGGFLAFWLLYFNLSVLTSFWTSLGWSALLAAVFSLGVLLSVHFRVAVTLSLLQIVSPFGLVSTHLTISWLEWLNILENFIQVQQMLRTSVCQVISETQSEVKATANFNWLETIIIFMHYGSIIPYLCLLFYSFLYEITYNVRQRIRTSNSRSGDGTINNYNRMHGIYLNILSGFAGGVLMFTMALFLCEYFYFHAVVEAAVSENCRSAIRGIESTVAARIYIVICILLGVIIPFSDQLLKLRGIIIEHLINDDGIVIVPRNIEMQERVQRQPNIPNDFD